MFAGIGIPAEPVFGSECLDDVHTFFFQVIDRMGFIPQNGGVIPYETYALILQQRQVRIDIFGSHLNAFRVFGTGGRKRKTKYA